MLGAASLLEIDDLEAGQAARGVLQLAKARLQGAVRPVDGFLVRLARAYGIAFSAAERAFAAAAMWR